MRPGFPQRGLKYVSSGVLFLKSRTVEDLLRARAESNGGYLARSEVLSFGNDDRDIQGAIAAGVLVRLRRGAYAFADDYNNLDPLGRHAVLARSVADRLGPNVVLSHASACALHGFALFDVDLSVVHVTRMDGGAGRCESNVAHHVGVPPRDDELVEIDGRLVTAPPRAVWEASTTTTGPGALVVMDSALRDRAVDIEQLRSVASAHAHWQGARRADLSLRFADGRSESVGESLTRFMCFRHGIPRPTLQHEVRDTAGNLIGRTDEAWLQYAHVGEFDGRVKYVRLLKPGESVSDVVVREKRREDLIRAQGFGMSRFVWDEVLPANSKARAERLRYELEQSRRLYLRGRTAFAV